MIKTNIRYMLTITAFSIIIAAGIWANTHFANLRTNLNDSVMDSIVQNGNYKVVEIDRIMQSMFPEKQFTKSGTLFHVKDSENYYIESIIPGSFVKREGDELLVVVRRLNNELTHAKSFYNAYMAVWDNQTGEMISSVKLFSADKGKYYLLPGQGITYIFFTDNVTYQCQAEWSGELWLAGREWRMK